MARYALRDANIRAISLVKEGANRKRFYLKKSGEVVDTPVDGGRELDELSSHSRMVKTSDWSVVYCVVAEPGWAEGQGIGDTTGTADEDVWLEPDEIRKAAHQFMRNGGLVNHMHADLEPYGQVVENFVAPADMTVAGEVIKAGSWCIGICPNAAGKDAIENGELGGVSIQGDALRVLVEKAAITTSSAPAALANPQRGLDGSGRKRRRQVDEPDAFTRIAKLAHEPTIGSKGNGLWGIPHAQLPAKIQHVYNDLVQGGKKTGSETYRLAVGIVEDWAAGHDGHGNTVNAKTVAEAQAAMVEFNKLRAQAKADNIKKGSPMHTLLAAIAKKVGIDPDSAEFAELEKANPTFAQIIGRQELSEELPGAMDAMREALYNAFYPFSVAGEEPTPAETRAALAQSLDEFGQYMLGLYDGIESGSIKKSAEEMTPQVATLRPSTDPSEEDTMDETKIAELMKSAVEDAVKPLTEKVTELEGRLAKAEEDKPPTAEELKATASKLEKSLEKVQADIAKLGEGSSTTDGGDDPAEQGTEALVAIVRKSDPHFSGVLLA